MDSAVAGEAAGYTMGLILLGLTPLVRMRCLLTHGRPNMKNHSWPGYWCWVIYYRRREEADETIQMLLAEKVCRPLFVQ
jgi:26S proteasome regulatory subunit N2